ncbi:hypothetical protein HDU81_004027 [Chytriomyces hyalinus]|nr:hypothetical protein HDU81_004027 [Chytriomyces hyalinus]
MSGNSKMEHISRADLFQTIELKTSPYSKEAFADYLEREKETMNALLDAFKPPSAASRKTLDSCMMSYEGQSIKIKQAEHDFLVRVSETAQLDETQSFLALRGFLRHQFQSAAGRTRYASLVYDDALLDAVLAFYFNERTCSLDGIAAMIRSMNDGDHPYAHELKSVLPVIIRTPLFMQNALTQLTQRMSSRVPLHLETQSRRAVRWSVQNLREQKGLLQILFTMFYDEVEVDSNVAVDIIKTLNASKFGLDQPNASLFEEEAYLLWNDVTHLCVVIALTVMDLERVMDVDESMDDDSSQLVLIQHPNQMYELTKLFQKYLGTVNLNEGAVISPLLLAWGSLLQKLSNSPMAEQLLQDHGVQAASDSVKFVEKANELGVFDYLENSTKSYADIQDNPNIVGYKSVLKGLLTLFISCFNVSDTPKFGAIVSCFVQLFQGSPDLCEQFWLQDYPLPDRRSLLDAARNKFPLEQGGLVKLLCSLCSNKATAGFVFKYLADLKAFTGTFESGMIETFPAPVLVKHYELGPNAHGKYSLLVRAGKPVRIISVHPPIMQMSVNYSAFHLFIAYMDAFLETSLTAQSRVTADVMLDWFLLLNTVLQHSEDSLPEVIAHLCRLRVVDDQEFTPNDFISMICRTFSRACAYDSLPTGLLTACLKTLSLLLPFESNAWYLLRQEMPIPRYSSDMNPSASGRYMQQRLLPYERSSGQYSTTLAFLDLVFTMCLESQHLTATEGLSEIQTEVLSSCVKYIHSEVFPTYNSWRYAKLSDKLNIGLKVLQIYNAILSDFTVSAKSREADQDREDISAKYNLRQFLVDAYLSGSMFQVSPVLDILGAGSEAPDRFYRAQKIQEGSIVEESIVEALSFVKMLLIERKVNGGGAKTLLEHAILDRSVTSASKGDVTELVHVIASYVSYDYNLNVPKLSSEVLILLCSVASEWTPRPPSFIGYFGSDALSVVSTFVELASYPATESGEDPKISKSKELIQHAVLSFVSVVLQTQKGLGTLFLTGGDSNSTSRSPKKPSKQPASARKSLSIVSSIEMILNNWKTFAENRPSILPAALHILEVLWRGAQEFHTALESVKEIKGFWETLRAIMDARFPDAEFCVRLNLQLAQSLVFKIFANEVFYMRDVSKLDNIVKAFKKVSAVEEFTNLFKNALSDASYAPKQTLSDELEKLQIPGLHMAQFIKPYAGVLDDYMIELGENSFYDSALLASKLGVTDTENFHIIAVMRELNLALSAVNVGVKMLKSVISFLKVCTLKIGLKMWSDTSKNSSERLLELTNVICEQVNGVENYSQHKLAIFSDVSSLLTLLLSTWSIDAGAPKASDFKDLSVVLFQCMDSLQSCLTNSDFRNLLFSPHELAHACYNQIWTAVLIMVKRLSSAAEFWKGSKFDAQCSKFCVGVLPYVLRSLEAILSTKKDVGYLSDHSLVLISLTNELMLFVDRFNLASETCVSMTRDSSVISLTMNFIYAASVTRQATDSNGAADELLISECMLRLFLVFARTPVLADELATSGLVAAFCNCEVSQLIVNGQVPVYLGAERNPVHRLWCLMVSVVGVTLRNRTRRAQFHNSVVGFLKLHWNQVESVFGVALDQSLNVGRLEELEVYTELMHDMMVVASSEPDGGDVDDGIDLEFMNACRDRELRVFSQSVYLLRHPATLASKCTLMSRDEMEFVSTATSLVDAGNDAQAAWVEYIKAQLTLINRNIISFICIAYNVEACLAVGNAGSYVKRGLSLGTLSEFLSNCLDTLAQTSKLPASSNSGRADIVLDLARNSQSMCLMVSQLIGLIVGHVVAHENEGRREAADNIQQAKSVLEILARDGKGGSCVKDVLREVDLFMERV